MVETLINVLNRKFTSLAMFMIYIILLSIIPFELAESMGNKYVYLLYRITRPVRPNSKERDYSHTSWQV